MAWIYFCFCIEFNWFLKSWCLMLSEKSDFIFCCSLQLLQLYTTIVGLWMFLFQHDLSARLCSHLDCLLLSFLCLWCFWLLVTAFLHSDLLPGFSWTCNSIIVIVFCKLNTIFLPNFLQHYSGIWEQLSKWTSSVLRVKMTMKDSVRYDLMERKKER